MEILGNIFGAVSGNEMIMGVVIIAISWLGKQAISWIVNKYPVLKKLKLQEKWERVIDKVKENKIEAKKQGKELSVHEIGEIVKMHSKDEGVDPTDVKLHRRALKRNALGLTLGFDRDKNISASISASRRF